MGYFTTKSVTTTHDLEKKLLQIKLKRKGTLKDLISVFSKAIKCAHSKNIKCWIVDISKTNGLSEKSEYWFNNTLYPAMMIRFGSGNYIGFVLSDEAYQVKLKEFGHEGLMSYNSFIRINTFPSNDQARKWIEEASQENSLSGFSF